MSARPFDAFVCATLLLLVPAAPVLAQTALSGDRISIKRTAGKITVDGQLDDEGWRDATRIEKWYEVNPGDNTEPKVRNVGYLAYDDHFFYAAFEFEDPDVKAIRAPFADRDNIGNGNNDYGGIIIDPRNSGRTATFFVATPRNIQYDAVTDDASGEDSSPDFFWDSATHITEHGWTLEIRIPFSSLRYRHADPQTWGILLYRNYPRDRHYQFFSAKLPRGGNCFICRSNTLTGLERLPSGGHLVVAPYVSAEGVAHPREELGSPLVTDPVKPHAGVDVKYTPNADNAIDATVKPDFSQIESDTAQISVNERFALFFPEKRPFFLEGADLFQTPVQAVYTRTISSPDWGGRLTGKEAGMRYTVLVTEDNGGGSVILPGPNGSDLATPDFGSTTFIARVKREIGLSFVGMLFTDREAQQVEGSPDAAPSNGHNRVFGPDFQWRPSGSDFVTGQLLYSASKTPTRPDLADEWTGQQLSGHAASLQWGHNRTHLDWFGQYNDYSNGFRADNGFVPQVGYRAGTAGGGWTVRPKGFLSRQRTFLNVDYEADRTGALISRQVMPGLGMDTKWGGFLQFRYHDERVRSGDQVIGRKQFGYVVQFSPSRRLSEISLDGRSGQEIDFANSRPGHGTTLNLSGRINPTQHLEVALVQNQSWLDVDDAAGTSARLFTARVSRIRATYTFTARMFVRGITQYVTTDRDPSLYLSPVPEKSAAFSGSLLLAYKLNWQSVMFVGYGDDRELTDANQLAPLDRQFFVKLSYALQR
jgi:Domain of unknown function (DUF5916)